MPHLTKRKKQIAYIPRKKGYFVQEEDNKTTVIVNNTTTIMNQLVIERVATTNTEVIVNINIQETVEKWSEKDLREFEKIKEKFVSEALNWYKEAGNNLKTTYIGNSRTTVWRQNKKKKNMQNIPKK
ncbi:432_t:CDS:2, partial [Acaulospora morrowiae]